MPLSWQSALENIEWAYFYSHSSSFLAFDICLSQKNDLEKKELTEFHQKKKESLLPYILRIQDKKPLITASDLKQEGFLPGVQMGELLKEAERISINEQIEDKEVLIKRLKDTLNEKSDL